MTSLNSELIIDSGVIRHNISYIKGKIKNKSKFMAVIKSDALAVRAIPADPQLG